MEISIPNEIELRETDFGKCYQCVRTSGNDSDFRVGGYYVFFLDVSSDYIVHAIEVNGRQKAFCVDLKDCEFTAVFWHIPKCKITFD